VADTRERAVGSLRVQIDRELCVGFGDCVEQAPGAFRLDGQSLAEFSAPETIAHEALLAACRACPVDAITVWDENGSQLVP
jgi:ferredoxin